MSYCVISPLWHYTLRHFFWGGGCLFIPTTRACCRRTLKHPHKGPLTPLCVRAQTGPLAHSQLMGSWNASLGRGCDCSWLILEVTASLSPSTGFLFVSQTYMTDHLIRPLAFHNRTVYPKIKASNYSAFKYTVKAQAHDYTLDTSIT